MSLEMEVEASKKVEEGKHIGTIVRLETREGVSKKNNKPYKYVDVHILEENGAELKAGYSAFITPSSQLGKLLQRFGVVLLTGAKVDLEGALLQRRCTFLTKDRESGGAVYSDVVIDTVKPLAGAT